MKKRTSGSWQGAGQVRTLRLLSITPAVTISAGLVLIAVAGLGPAALAGFVLWLAIGLAALSRPAERVAVRYFHRFVAPTPKQVQTLNT
jgi:hypothetical protein